MPYNSYPFWEKNRADSASMNASFERQKRDECQKELDKLKIKLKEIMALLEKSHTEGKINSEEYVKLKQVLES